MNWHLFRSVSQLLYHNSSIPHIQWYAEHLISRFRRNPWNLMPPEPPPAPVKRLRAPRGFRFASEPPDMNDLVHLANDHPYLRSRVGERVDFLEGYGSQAKLTNVGIVLGRMNSDDPRARVANASSPGSPGLYVREQGQEPRWYSSHRIFREVDGRLTHRR